MERESPNILEDFGPGASDVDLNQMDFMPRG